MPYDGGGADDHEEHHDQLGGAIAEDGGARFGGDEAVGGQHAHGGDDRGIGWDADRDEQDRAGDGQREVWQCDGAEGSEDARVVFGTGVLDVAQIGVGHAADLIGAEDIGGECEGRKATDPAYRAPVKGHRGGDVGERAQRGAQRGYGRAGFEDGPDRRMALDQHEGRHRGDDEAQPDDDGGGEDPCPVERARSRAERQDGDGREEAVADDDEEKRLEGAPVGFDERDEERKQHREREEAEDAGGQDPNCRHGSSSLIKRNLC